MTKRVLYSFIIVHIYFNKIFLSIKTNFMSSTFRIIQTIFFYNTHSHIFDLIITIIFKINFSWL